MVAERLSEMARLKLDDVSPEEAERMRLRCEEAEQNAGRPLTVEESLRVAASLNVPGTKGRTKMTQRKYGMIRDRILLCLRASGDTGHMQTAPYLCSLFGEKTARDVYNALRRMASNGDVELTDETVGNVPLWKLKEKQ
jgi:hypothetical protein